MFTTETSVVLSMKTTSEDCVMVGVFCNASTLPKKKIKSLFFVLRCSHFRCGSQRLDCLLLEVVICRGGRQITLYLLKHITMGLAHIVQFAIETLRMKSEVTTSRKKRCEPNHFCILFRVKASWLSKPPRPLKSLSWMNK